MLGPEFCWFGEWEHFSAGFFLLVLGLVEGEGGGLCMGREGEGGEKTYGHAQDPGTIVFEGEVLVIKGFGAVDGGAASAVAVEEIAALAHEVFDLEN